MVSIAKLTSSHLTVYVAGGVVTTIIETIIFWLLVAADQEKSAYLIASSIAFVLNFIWHTKLTFKARGRHSSKFFYYAGLKLCSALLGLMKEIGA